MIEINFTCFHGIAAVCMTENTQGARGLHIPHLDGQPKAGKMSG